MEDINQKIEEIELQVLELTRRLDLLAQPKQLDPITSIRLPLDAESKKAINSIAVFPVTIRIKNTDAATAANYGQFFIADKSYRVVSATEVHGTKGTDASAVTLTIEKLTGTTAPDSGTALLQTAFDLKGNNQTVQYGTLVTTDAVLLGRGDRLCLKDSGTLTAVANVVVTVYLQQL